MLSLNFYKNVFIIGQVNNIITRIRPLKIFLVLNCDLADGIRLRKSIFGT